MKPDSIQIVGLDLPVRIGVPEAERARWQSLAADLTLHPAASFDGLGDQLAATVDYESVANEVKKWAAERPRHLIETLAVDIAQGVLEHFPVNTVVVELRKRILPGVDHVAVRVARSRT